MQRNFLPCPPPAALALALALALAGPARAADDAIKMPSGVDYSRMKLLEKGQPALMKVYVNMVGIGGQSDTRLLISRRAGESVGTHQQMNRKFIDAVQSTKRFEVYDDSATGMRDLSDIVVDGMVVTAMQDIEDLTAVRKSVTTVRLSIQVKDTASGRLLQARTVSGVYGSEPGEGTIIRSQQDLQSKETQEKLANDFERALKEALENAATFIERTYRPIAKVVDVDGKDVVITGGEMHGIRPNDQLVVFQGKFINDGGKMIPGVMKPLALIGCGAVGAESSQCVILRQNGDVKGGLFALVVEDSLKLLEK